MRTLVAVREQSFELDRIEAYSERQRARMFAEAIGCDLTLYQPRETLKVPEPADTILSSPRVLAWVRKAAGYVEWDHELACAICDASLEDPLFQGPAGAVQTAAFLLALACTSGSGLHPNRIGGGDGSLGYGIYAIRMPPNSGHLPADVLLLPRTASYVAIDLARQSLDAYPVAELEDFHWFPESDPPSERDLCIAAERAYLTRMLLKEAA
jgi:hypothetical protein